MTETMQKLDYIIKQVHSEEQFIQDAKAWDEKCKNMNPQEEAERFELFYQLSVRDQIYASKNPDAKIVRIAGPFGTTKVVVLRKR